ncbi:MAG TPA: hypothetical protein VGH97_04585 [Thermoanaerobaculia bacterium]
MPGKRAPHKLVPDKAVAKYLARHAEPESLAADAVAGEYAHALVVPAYGEGQSLFDTLGSVPRGPAGDTLLVVVLNAREDSPREKHEANAAARERLLGAASEARALQAEHPLSVLSYPNGRVVLVDRAAPGHFLPEGQGVGLARKIGNDLLLRLHASGRLASEWLHNTDADVILPNDYFDQTRTIDPGGNAAALYFFEHRFSDDETLALAGRLYEISLRYYTLGLAWCGSPYAYQAMGSCLAIRPHAYARVHGFPERNATEDFYILNKLAKVGSIVRLAGTPVVLEGRISDRVPIGTGKALSKLVASRRNLAGFRLYHPLAFAHVAAWLGVLASTARSGGRIELALEQLPRDNPFFRSDLLVEALEKMGAFPAIRQAIERSSEPGAMLRAFHTWFDSFRTLKLIHALRDGGIPSLPYAEALAEAPFTGLTAATEDDAEWERRELADRERSLAASPAGLPSLASALADA